jgi:uncharacterized protein (DUF885 family)
MLHTCQRPAKNTANNRTNRLNTTKKQQSICKTPANNMPKICPRRPKRVKNVPKTCQDTSVGFQTGTQGHQTGTPGHQNWTLGHQTGTPGHQTGTPGHQTGTPGHQTGTPGHRRNHGSGGTGPDRDTGTPTEPRIWRDQGVFPHAIRTP